LFTAGIAYRALVGQAVSPAPSTLCSLPAKRFASGARFLIASSSATQSEPVGRRNVLLAFVYTYSTR